MFNFLCKNDSDTRECKVSRKQKAIADREQELLFIAKKLVEEEGFHNFTMDKLTKASDYSKGTIYNHFSSKEDVITALCTVALRQEMSFFNRAKAFEGNTRERALAFHVAYVMSAKVEPVLFNCVLTAKTPWVMQKASPERLQQQLELEQECTALVDSMFHEALASGDLKISTSNGIDSLVFANWSVAFGGIALMSSASTCHSITRLRDHNVFLFNINTLLDGLGWQPLSDSFDYQRTWKRVEETIFSEELKMLIPD